MKIDPNAGFFPDAKRLEMLRSTLTTEAQKETIYIESRGIPIRLAIAAQIAGHLAALHYKNMDGVYSNPECAEASLEIADALIAAHNEGEE